MQSLPQMRPWRTSPTAGARDLDGESRHAAALWTGATLLGSRVTGGAEVRGELPRLFHGPPLLGTDRTTV